MLDEIRSARRSIALASYIFRADRVGNVFIEALRSAHTKGVEVRVLVDGIGSGYFIVLRRKRVAAFGYPYRKVPA